MTVPLGLDSNEADPASVGEGGDAGGLRSGPAERTSCEGNSQDIAADTVENRPFDELALDDVATISRTLTADDLDSDGSSCGGIPARRTPQSAQTGIERGNVADTYWAVGLLTGLIDDRLPGPGTTCLAQNLQFPRPLAVGETITASVRVIELRADQRIAVLGCRVVDEHQEAVITGTIEVRAPALKVRRPRASLPDVRITRHARQQAMVRSAAGGPPIVTAVVHPCDADALAGAVEAAARGLIVPVLVGPRAKILAAAAAAGRDIGSIRIEDAPHSHAAAARAVELVTAGSAAMLMKGSLHTDELMHAVLATGSGLRTERRASHAYLIDVPGYDRSLILTDAAINIAPTLADKADIARNAIDLAHALGVSQPKLAILSAVETVDPAIPSTIDAAALCKMAERGQIVGGIVDGPLGFDNAISVAAARQKGICSPVAGVADVLLVPDLEAGNMLAKQLIFLAGADAAGVVLGARVPIVLTSRADSVATRVASCAVAVLMARRTALGTRPSE